MDLFVLWFNEIVFDKEEHLNSETYSRTRLIVMSRREAWSPADTWQG